MELLRIEVWKYTLWNKAIKKEVWSLLADFISCLPFYLFFIFKEFIKDLSMFLIRLFFNDNETRFPFYFIFAGVGIFIIYGLLFLSVQSFALKKWSCYSNLIKDVVLVFCPRLFMQPNVKHQDNVIVALHSNGIIISCVFVSGTVCSLLSVGDYNSLFCILGVHIEHLTLKNCA